jgi:hypothetical protein
MSGVFAAIVMNCVLASIGGLNVETIACSAEYCTPIRVAEARLQGRNP